MLHYSPDIFYWVHIWAARRPGKNAVRKFFLEVTLDIPGRVLGVIVLLKDPLVTDQCIGIAVEMIIQDFTVQVAIQVLREKN